jgi:hypothetical protein
MPGDVVFTARLAYRVTGAREVDSRVWCNRWALDLELLGTREELAGRYVELVDVGARAFGSRRYRRGETPTSCFGEHHPAAS